MRRLFLRVALLIAFACTAPAAPKKSTAASKPKPKPAAEKSTEDQADDEPNEKPQGEKKELAPGELPLAARSAMLLDAASGDVLYEKNPDAMEYPASATKILTALVVIETGDLDKLVTVEHADTQVEPSALDLKPGETYPRRHLLYALLLKSANDVAMALARDNAGSIQAFAERMTKRAQALGAESSHFMNPHGLHDPHHYTTARDLARIGREAMKNPLFREIVATPDAWIRKADEWVWFRNHNRLLSRMTECIGVKTGYTRAAQQVLVSAATKSGKEVVSVVLHTNKPGIWDDSKLLLEHGLARLTAPPPAPSSPTQAQPATQPPSDAPAPTGAAAPTGAVAPQAAGTPGAAAARSPL
jgi:serine-type D-Ala-D-Ala carboxypeptidase (penicillin-binding protein 5/6)